MSDFAALECELHPDPLFPVEPPDGRKELSELDRQAWLVSYVRRTSPRVIIYANANAAKRGFKAQAQVRKEGLIAGVPDLTVAWDVADAVVPDGPTTAWLEMKGYDSNGRPGKLSAAQIEVGNKFHRCGMPVACFFSAKSAIQWLRSLGCPLQVPA